MNKEQFLDIVIERLTDEGFESTREDSHISAHKKSSPIPFIKWHEFLYVTPTDNSSDPSLIVRVNQENLDKTEQSRGYRYGSLGTECHAIYTILFSQNGFSEDVLQVLKKKPRHQTHYTNLIALCDLKKEEIYTLEKLGYVGIIPLHYGVKKIKRIFSMSPMSD